jgi:hypothetical protein
LNKPDLCFEKHFRGAEIDIIKCESILIDECVEMII